jgi:hypothetical protein
MVDHRRPSSVAPPPTEVLLNLRVMAGRVGLDAAVRNGREMVVTSIDCFRMALSETFAGRKLRMQSNGRWDESTGGRLCLLAFENVKDDKRFLDGDDNLSLLRCSAEDWGELGTLSEEAKRNTLGGDNEPGPAALSRSASDNSAMPSPPDLRQTRATRSAHSSTLTNRIAPASSIARGDVKRRMRIVGNVVIGGILGGWWVASINKDDSKCCECNNGSISLNCGATWAVFS